MCIERVQDLAVVMICRCCTVSVNTQLWSPLMQSENKPKVRESDCDADVDTAMGDGGEGREGEWRGMSRKENGGRGKRWILLFKWGPIIKLIAWQGESRITTLLADMQYYFQSPLCLFLFEQPCLLEREASLTFLIGTLLSGLRGLTTDTATAELWPQRPDKAKKLQPDNRFLKILMTLQLSTFLSLVKSLLACAQWHYFVWMTKLIIVIRASKWTKNSTIKGWWISTNWLQQCWK